jgi:hypothetical protein
VGAAPTLELNLFGTKIVGRYRDCNAYEPRMSRGLGRTQRAILALIAAEPGPWTVEELCRLVYKSQPGWNLPRAQVVSVARALKTMRLPGKWKFGRVGWERRQWLYDGGNLASVQRRLSRMETFEVPLHEAEALSDSSGWVTLTFDHVSDLSTEIVLTGFLSDGEV